MNPQPQAMFFDLDGTILDLRTGMEEMWRAACEEHRDGSFEPARMHEAIRARRTWFWDDAERARTGRMDLDAASREIVRHAFGDLGIEAVDLAHGIADDYRARRATSIEPYPGAVETLRAFRERGIRMALLTNGEAANQRRNIERHGLAAHFDCIVIEGEFGVGKPDERVFQHALAVTSSTPEATWMIGDSLESDIAPAVSMGLHGVWVDPDGLGVPADAAVQPHRVVRAISELM